VTRPAINALFEGLRRARDPAEAQRLEREIWQRWMESDDARVRMAMARGLQAMSRQDYRAALAAFDSVVKAAPDFAEGWNKRATVYWLLGDREASARDIERTLALEPRHFGALSGLALVREAQGRVFEALDALERVEQVHPHLPHLTERIEQLGRRIAQVT
jgi:tetratricopeptide (TPR) repeat protein